LPKNPVLGYNYQLLLDFFHRTINISAKPVDKFGKRRTYTGGEKGDNGEFLTQYTKVLLIAYLVKN